MYLSITKLLSICLLLFGVVNNTNAQACFQTISAGYNFSIGIKTDGTLWAWGAGANGSLGVGTLTNKNVPTQIGTATNWQTINAGGGHNFAVKTDGTLWVWGGEF
jgi:alpha-tubulin suppressor-like RCC1 family protein